MSDMQVQVELKVKDDLSKPAATALDSLGKSAQKAETAADAIGRASGMQKVSRDATDAARSMDAVGRETRTMEQRLKGAEQSAVSFRRTLTGVQSIARDAASHVTNMGKGLVAAGRALPAVGGGAMAAGYVAKSALDKPMDYESRLASMANVAYADKDAAGRVAGMKGLDASIVDAVRTGGGSRDSAAEALNTLLAAGTDEGTAKQLLPVIQKAATASGADGKELAAILTKGISQKQFSAAEAQAAIDKAIKAGEAGQFELKDMARWLPQIISAGKGMKGMAGYEAHLANLQGIANVTGSNDQAGNAYFNLLGKITSTDAAANFKKMKVNLPAALSKAAQAGTDPVTAFVQLVETKVVAKDKRFQALQKKIAATGDKDEKRALMEQAAEILQGSAIGKVIQDREALLGLVGIMNQRDSIADVRQQLQQAEGSTTRSFDVVASTTSFKAQQASNEKDIAMSAAMDRVKAPLDATLERATQFAQDNPLAATAAAGTGTVGTMAAAGGATASLLQGGSAASGALRAAEATARGTAKTAPVLGLGMAAYDIYQTENDATLTRNEKNIANMETYGGFGGALAGTAMGAAAGSAVPVIGTAIGALIGGIIGYFSGGKAGKATGQMIWDEEDNTAQTADTASPTAQQQPQPIIIEQRTVLEVDGATLAEVVNRNNAREGARH